MAFVSAKSCLLCGSASRTTLLRRPYDEPPVSEFIDRYYQGRIPPAILAGATYEVARCDECSFVWQVERLDEPHSELLYSQWISGESSLAVKRDADIAVYSGYCRQIELIPGLVGAKAPETKVLDFGMGWGRWCQMARALGFDASGLESSEDRLAHARKSGVPCFRDFSELADLRFDFINAEQVFEHIGDPLGALRRLVECLSDRGVVRISVPNAGRDLSGLAERDWSPTSNAFHPLEHINGFTNRTLRSLGRKAGLTPLPQPFLPGQGLLGKSFRRGLGPLFKSLVGTQYRKWWGTTLWFGLLERP